MELTEENKESALNEKEYKTMEEFWPYYLSEHSNSLNRSLHVLGSAAGLGWLAASVIKKKPSYLLYGVLNGYAMAWIGHFLIEKNRPATFKYPLKSFASDWKMFSAVLSGKIKDELEKAGVEEK